MTHRDAALQARAATVEQELKAQDDAWGTGGWTRRRFLAGIGMAGVAALGSQLVTTRAAYAAVPSSDDRTLITIFMRGAADGLRILVPASGDLGMDYLTSVRRDLVPAASDMIALPGGWGLNNALAPLHDQLWDSNEMAFVPAVSTSGVSRSHFQAQQYLENGGSDTESCGWLNRALGRLGPGTTFRAVADGAALPVSMLGAQQPLALSSLSNFVMPGWDDAMRAANQRALTTLYRGVGGTLGEDVPTTMRALATAKTITPSTADYPDGDFADALKNLSSILKAEVGMQVATVDVGGWDTHTDEATDLDRNLAATAAALKAFFDDLGPHRRSRVTVVLMTEFGRRVAMNASGGTDHGHGSLMWLLGGGLAKSTVAGKWNALGPDTLDSGDVPGLNNPFDVFGELLQQRLGVGSLSSVFVNHRVTPLGLARSS